ncbi:hypothetical protein KDD17_02640 [Sulfitobacter albidus]|uniref:Trypsin-like peptidase domain-containing protein n=1 Tax=Sulfitobacter albidus TaxID=2829501 RepID=A0A975PMM7_9RHOB|nr:hypothetical protein [Sulfitobacter albidus]QUJ76967.1 hypothetical protein KDD17_02640 [Sulfitobacter albidus]
MSSDKAIIGADIRTLEMKALSTRNGSILLLLPRILAFWLLSVTAIHAQTVTVVGSMGENGHGWMFRSQGICYVITPRHVAGELPRISVTSAAPVVNGTGTVFRPFWPEMDLAIAVVRGGIEERCIENLDSLNVSRAARNAGTAQLLRLSPSGELERQRLNLARRDYLTWQATLADAGGSIYQGTSGAFAFANDEPIGMAIESEDVNSILLMRSAEIYMNVARFLAEESGAVTAQSEPVHEVEANEQRLELVSATAAPIEPQYAAENLLTEGSYVFDPIRNTEILFRAEGDAPVALSQFIMIAPINGTYALPKDILVLTDASAAGTRFRPWVRGQVAPDGAFDSGPNAPRSARWIKILILNARAAGPVAIERISVF